MKKIFYSIILGGIVFFGACSEEKNNTETAESSVTSKDTVTAVIEDEALVNENEIVSKYNYDKDWELIKKAILAKDFQELSAWARTDEFDAEMFIEMAQEDYFVEALKKTTYNDLRVEEMNGEMYLIFNASVTEIGEDGTEYGSGIALYLYQGDPSLMLEYFIAAG